MDDINHYKNITAKPIPRKTPATWEMCPEDYEVTKGGGIRKKSALEAPYGVVDDTYGKTTN